MLRPTPQLFLNKGRSFFGVFKNWGSTCEKVDRTKPREPEEKYVIEKRCGPSIFEAWKPKIPELKSQPLKMQLWQAYIPPKKCVAGMKVPPKNRCEIETEAKDCEKKNHPSWIKHCPPKLSKDRGQSLLQEALVQCKESKGTLSPKPKPKKMRKKCSVQVPKPDWNHDGLLG